MELGPQNAQYMAFPASLCNGNKHVSRRSLSFQHSGSSSPGLESPLSPACGRKRQLSLRNGLTVDSEKLNMGLGPFMLVFLLPEALAFGLAGRSEGPSTQYIRFPVPETISLLVFGTRVLEC